MTTPAAAAAVDVEAVVAADRHAVAGEGSSELDYSGEFNGGKLTVNRGVLKFKYASRVYSEIYATFTPTFETFLLSYNVITLCYF